MLDARQLLHLVSMFRQCSPIISIHTALLPPCKCLPGVERWVIPDRIVTYDVDADRTTCLPPPPGRFMYEGSDPRVNKLYCHQPTTTTSSHHQTDDFHKN